MLRRMISTGSAALLVLSLGATPASAQPPANDDVGAATVVTGLPFVDSVDTTEATTAPDDPDCSGQGPTVWYSFTPSEDGFVEANTFGSNYDTTLSVYRDGSQLACNDDAGGSLQSRVVFEAEGGGTYLVMVGAFADGPGGDLEFEMREASPPGPPLELDLAVDPVGRFRRGVPTISATLTCSRPAHVYLDAFLRQRAGRVDIFAFGFTEFSCEGTTRVHLTLDDPSGRFAGGKAQVEAFAFAYDSGTDEYVDAFDIRAIRLRGGGPR